MIKYLNESNFNEEVISKKGVVLVDFFATWCPPCKMLTPVLEEISTSRATYNIAKIDVDENENLSMQYNISSVPTMLIFKDGEVVEKMIGYKNKEQLLEILGKYE